MTELTDDEKKVLGNKDGESNVNALYFKKVDNLADSDSEAMSDLEEVQVVAISLLRALDKHIVKIPATDEFTRQYVSLVRSRRRLGRMEYLEAIKRRPNYAMVPGAWPEQDNPAAQQPGLIQRFKDWWSRGGR